VIDESVYSRLVAVRYIAAILELPHFWSHHSYRLQRIVVDKLCRQTICLIEDIDPTVDNYDKMTYSDASGVDSLSCALLMGGGGWIELKYSSDLVVEEWFGSWVNLIKLLVQRQGVLHYTTQFIF
jgi:hypothetical protein